MSPYNPGRKMAFTGHFYLYRPGVKPGLGRIANGFSGQ